MKEVILKVSGMNCEHCKNHVQKALEDVFGVINADIDFNAGQAIVRYAEDRAEIAKMIEAIEEVGYTAQVI